MRRGRVGGAVRRRNARAVEVVTATARASTTSGSHMKTDGVDEAARASAAGEPEALSVTHWFESGTDGEPYSVTVRFSGRRVGTGARPAPHDTFVKEETIEGVVPASGPVSLTTRVYGLQPGEWVVTAELIRRSRQVGPRLPSDRRGHAAVQSLPRAAWSWRAWGLASATFAPLRTRWAPAVRLTAMPAVIPGSWSAFVGIGVLVGVVVQAALLAPSSISVGQALMVDLLALLAGLAGAKAWYLALNRGPLGRSIGEGWSVDGFLVVMPLVGAAALVALDLPIGAFLDASAPALFFGVALGRLGCFFTGCCAGRCTRSRWGIWSSDRRVGARRIPTQLLESVGGLLIGAVAFVLMLIRPHGAEGVLFVASAAAYVLVRQFLLRLRAEPHHPTRVRLTAIVATLVLVASPVALLLG